MRFLKPNKKTFTKIYNFRKVPSFGKEISDKTEAFCI